MAEDAGAAAARVGSRQVLPYVRGRLAGLSSGGRTLVKNFLSLSALQAVNYVLPLLTVPYLVRVLGPERFGLIGFAQALTQYFVILADYGFNLTATRKVAIARESPEALSRIFTNVMAAKAFLASLGFLVLSLLLCTVAKFRSDAAVYLLTFGMVIGNVLFPVWFFQGMERMEYITVLTVIGRLIFTVAIFAAVRQSADYLYVPLLNSLGVVTTGLLSLWTVHRCLHVSFCSPSLRLAWAELKDGWTIFVSMVAVSLYTASNTVILGLFTNNTVVGYYTAGEKIIRAVLALLGPVSQSIYPHINRLATSSKDLAIGFVRKAALLVGSVTFVLSLLVCALAAPLVNVVLGPDYGQSVVVVRILAFVPFLVSLSNMFGIQVMLPFGYRQAFLMILLAAGVLSILMAIWLVPLWAQIGTAVAFLVTEAFVTTTMFFYLQRRGIQLVRNRVPRTVLARLSGGATRE
jgi:PST family polysaccharide transporter